jgi:DUF1009 family protein
LFILDLDGAAGEWAAAYPGARVSLGQVGRALDLLRESGCDAIVMAGGLTRPSLARTRFDRKGLSMLPKVARLFHRGDDGLLAGVARLFEEEGFRVLGAEELLPGSLAGQGSMAGDPPPMAEIERGGAILDALAPFDIGQAVVIEEDRCLAVEGTEGTAAMLTRVAALRAGRDRGGVLVKMPKRGQDARIDRPAIGPDTIRAAAAARLSGIAVAAGGVIVLERAETERLAREMGIFLYGFRR